MCISIWLVALVLTNQYLMDVSIISNESDVNKQNFYQIMDSTPVAFMNLT